MTAQPQFGWTERTLTPLPGHLDAELRAAPAPPRRRRWLRRHPTQPAET